MLLFHLFSAQLLTSRGFKWSSHYCIRKSISIKAQRTHLSFFYFSKNFLHFPSLSLTFFWFLFPKKIKPNRKGNKLSIELTSKRFLKHNKTTTSLRHLSLSLSRKKLLFMFCWERERQSQTRRRQLLFRHWPSYVVFITKMPWCLNLLVDYYNNCAKFLFVFYY